MCPNALSFFFRLFIFCYNADRDLQKEDIDMGTVLEILGVIFLILIALVIIGIILMKLTFRWLEKEAIIYGKALGKRRSYYEKRQAYKVAMKQRESK